MRVRRLAADDPIGPTRFEYRRFARPVDAEAEQQTDETESGTPDEEDATSEPEDITSTENYKEGYRQGLDTGIQEGYERGSQEKEEELTSALEQTFSGLLEAVQASAAEVSQEGDRVRQDFEAWLPRAVLLVSECVLRHETQTDVTSLAKVVREAVAELGAAEPLTVRLHPNDYDILAQQPAEVWSTDHLTFSPDQGVTQGGAVVESSTQVVDARMEARLLEAARTVLFPPDGAGNGSPAQ